MAFASAGASAGGASLPATAVGGGIGSAGSTTTVDSSTTVVPTTASGAASGGFTGVVAATVVETPLAAGVPVSAGRSTAAGDDAWAPPGVPDAAAPSEALAGPVAWLVAM